MENGHLLLTGNSAGPWLTRPVKTTFEVGNFSVTKAPAFSTVLNMASLNQLVSTFGNKGLAFVSASGDLELDGSRFSSKQLLADGGSLGLEASGWIDLQQKNMDLSGIVIPFSKVNKVVGTIPVLKQVMLGTNGKGMMAVDCSIKGSIKQPKVLVNRNSISPGHLQNILNLGKPPASTDTN
jgi:uncharacterized protein YhdP